MSTPITLLVLPGLDGTEVFFRPFLARLPNHVRPIVVPYPNAGRNDYAHLLNLAREAAAPLDAFYILGSSFAGPLAIMLAQAEPNPVRGVILSATFLRSPQGKLTQYKSILCAPLVWTIRVTRRIPV